MKLINSQEGLGEQEEANTPSAAANGDSLVKGRSDAWLSFWGWPGLLALAVCLLDQLSKWLIVSQWPEGTLWEIIPGFFNLVHVRNPGAAWGIMASHTWLLACLSLLAFLVLAIFFPRFHGGSRLASISLGAVQGGIAGNMFDRWFRQSVVDFLDFHLAGYHWPAFNIADSAICVGVTLLIVWSLFGSQPDSEKPLISSSGN